MGQRDSNENLVTKDRGQARQQKSPFRKFPGWTGHNLVIHALVLSFVFVKGVRIGTKPS